MVENERLSAIRNPGYGLRDGDRPMLWFDTLIMEGVGALQCFYQPEADDIIKEAGVKDVKDLGTKLCWVVVEDNLIRFKRMAKLP